MKRRKPTTPRIPTLSTGVGSLDRALGGGGYPRGRIIEVCGPAASGKTSLALCAVAACHRRDGVAAFIDTDHALDVRYAIALGVSPRRLLVSRPSHAEAALDIVEALVQSGATDLIVVDSIATLMPKAELREPLGNAPRGRQTRLVRRALRRLVPAAYRSQTTMLFVDQCRGPAEDSAHPPRAAARTRTVGAYCSVRLAVSRPGPRLCGAAHVDHRIRVEVITNKLTPPRGHAELHLR